MRNVVGKFVSLSLLVMTFCVFFCCCDSNKNDTDVALTHLYELQDYVKETGDTDLYLWFMESMDNDYLNEYVKETFSIEFENKFNEGVAAGYEDGFSDGASLILDFMDDKSRQKWMKENVDIVEKYNISY